MTGYTNEEKQICQLIESWAEAVRNRNLEGILASHSKEFVMYDVPEPFESFGLDAYRKTWDIFFKYTKPGIFDIHELQIIAGENVAFAFGKMQCADKAGKADYEPLDFRLTVGLRKEGGQWMILHEHHSIPAEQGK